ncbi:MAG: ABC transporter ATP-binding protein [Pirellulales bacterium]
MNNFGRVLRLALQYRLIFAGSVLCALLVAVLWGGNIGAAYPLIEVTFQNRSLQEWADSKIALAETKCADLEQRIAKLEYASRAASPEQEPSIAAQLRLAQANLAAEQRALGKYRWMKPYIDNYLPRSPFQTVVWITGLLLLGTIIKSVFLVANWVLVNKMAELATFRLRSMFYRRTLGMDLAGFGVDGTSTLMSRFTYDVDSVSAGLKVLLGKMIREPLKMAACLIGAGWICWRLLLLSLIIAPPAAFLISRLAKMLKRANRRAMEEMSQIYNTLDETFNGIKVVKAFTMERHERQRFHNNGKSYFRKAMRIAKYDSLTRPITEVMGIATICLALLAGAYLVLEQETYLLGVRMSERPLDLPTLMVFYGLLAGVSDPARKLSEVLSQLQRGSAAADRIYEMLDREPGVRDPAAPKVLPRHRRELAFDDISFRYNADKSVIENLTLRIPFGETLAIVGPNGCGKSTLANLIPRFYDPVEGCVRLDGVDLKSVRLRDLRNQIGLVTQETMLFDETIYNNIRYGSPSATREEVIEAAKQAHAHRFIEEQLQQGYDTVVGSHGGRLSGGQRQRIALARAILRDPAILILDEATSQIDLESEQLIQKVLEQFIRHRTAIVITHRLGLLAMADRILVMHEGRMMDVGTHDELLRRCELYGRLYHLQFQDLRGCA